MKVDRLGVHRSHCCPKCGCRYYDPQCPVVLGVLVAEFDCESCKEAEEDLRNSFLRMEIPELEKTVLHLERLIQEKKSQQVKTTKARLNPKSSLLSQADHPSTFNKKVPAETLSKMSDKDLQIRKKYLSEVGGYMGYLKEVEAVERELQGRG